LRLCLVLVLLSPILILPVLVTLGLPVLVVVEVLCRRPPEHVTIEIHLYVLLGLEAHPSSELGYARHDSLDLLENILEIWEALGPHEMCLPSINPLHAMWERASSTEVDLEALVAWMMATCLAPSKTLRCPRHLLLMMMT
jgi:hypothetical protein